MKHHWRKTAMILALAGSAGIAATVAAHSGGSGMMGGGMMPGGTGNHSGGHMMGGSSMMSGAGMHMMPGHGGGMMDRGSGMMHHGGHGWMHGGGMGMAKALGLNDEQRHQLLESRSKHRRAQFERMADMMDLRDEMHGLMSAERPDPDAVKALHGRMAELHGEMLADRIRFRNELHDTLTDEQREQLRKHKRGQGMGMGQHGDRRGQGGGMMQQ